MTAVNASGAPTPTSPSSRSVRRGRRTGSLLGLLAVSALILAMFHQSTGRAQQSADTATATPNASPTVAITPAPDALRLTLDFTELNDSGVTGTATFYEAGERTIVDIDVKNTGKDHPAHIHAGTCAKLEAEPAFTLNDVHEDGKSRSVIDAPLAGLINGDFAIDLHLSPTELGTLIDCADIKGEPTLPGTVSTPQATASASTTTTPAPTPTATVAGAETVAPAPTTATEVTPTAAATIPAATQTPAPTATATPSAATSGIGGPTKGVGGETTTTTAVPAGDGTGTGTSTSSATTFVSSAGTVQTAGLSASGSGPLRLIPDTPADAIIWSTSTFAAILFLSGIWIRRGEQRHVSHRQSPRWSRLGM